MINEISRNPAVVVSLRPAGEAPEIRDNATPSDAASNPAKTEPRKASKVSSGEQLGAIVEKLNDFVQQVQRELEFSIDEENGEVVVKVVDARTRDVVREIPPEEVREMRKRLNEVAEKLFQESPVTSMLFQAKA